MTTARQIITLALEDIGAIGANETMSAEDADYCLRQLNMIADSFSAGRADLFKDQLTSGTVTGASFTIGTGSFVNVGTGSDIQGLLADNYPVTPITFEQYRDIFSKNTTGRPLNYAYNGYDTIYLYPAAVNNVITVQAREDITQFANLDTSYNFPSGYQSAFVYSLEMAVAQSYGVVTTPSMQKKLNDAMKGIESANVRPLIISSNPEKKYTGNILNGFN